MKLKLPLLALSLVLSSHSWAQTATFAFTGTSTGDNQFNSVSSAPTGGAFSLFTRTAVSYNSGANYFNSSSWNTGSAIDLAEYVSYSVTPTAGNISYLQQVSFGSQKSGTGPANAQVSLLGNTSQAAIASQTFAPPTSIAPTTFNFGDVITGEALTFRFYGWNSGGTGGTLRFDNVATTGASANFQASSSNLTLTAGTKVYADASSLTISGNLSGAGGLTKIGTNTTTLTGTNTYTGATIISAGTLVVNGGGITSDVTVESGATLGGIGLIDGSVSLSGGTYAVGNSPGTQTVTGGVDFGTGAGSIFSWDLSVADPSSIDSLTSYDKVITPTVTGSGAIFQIVFGDDDFSTDFWSQSHTWSDIFMVDATTPVFDWASVFSSITTSPSASDFGSFSVSGNNLTWSAVPEPSSALAGLLLGAGLLRRRRAVVRG